ncbi:MSMEG_1061 family FMN-dependent PPOX-type flavoprotein [Phenylobacterium sp.]|uniref:MSMEG_1061 family FMN-dependent PPOX-type flavoprotein n=1 Tax=Phenylobacterium sp. TaxID=1871053 RepID=UPI0025FBB89D|nr:MSMEG_1061 family FMN-dependent PPOX-type flavoprotein [Phenylobacterium sp.]MBX3483198.1 pyridoxamine 5'-phosphate oxidase family protein [Phenylobacterium sp.]MCW5761101.1 pyridoxamine 5'-phosphate oxidase family protein [Phenylobacterium sp.]
MPDDASARTATEQLDALYLKPHKFTVAKDIGWVDPHGRRFIGLSPFVALATVGANGGLDVSPRGGGAGFVRVAEDGRSLLLPDRPGNNRLDSLRNIAEGSGEVGLMFMIPGVDDIYRVNGSARLVVDDELARTFEEFGKVPKSLIRVEVREAYLHCPRALMRSDLWGDSHRVDRSILPSLSEMVSDQLSLPKPEATHEQQVESLRQGL